jgi:hypothetical protein
MGYSADWGWDLGGLFTKRGDTIHCFEAGFPAITNLTGASFNIEQVVPAGTNAYLRTYYGNVLKMESDQISLLKAPGFCEALTATTAGKLLASFNNFGIYEFSDQWHQIYDTPFTTRLSGRWKPLAGGRTTRLGQRWVHLAEDDGKIAIAFERHPNERINSTDSVYDIFASLWVSKGQGLEPVPFAYILPRKTTP